MQVDIYINEKKLDVNDNTKIAETRQVADFFKANDRQTSYSNTFKLPKTDRNIKILGGMGVIGNTSIMPYRVHKVSVYRDGIQTISDGIAYFKPTNKSFNLFIYNDNINLFDKLGDKSLADLNLTSLNHNLNIETWLSSFERKDYTYAIADYGKLDNSTIEINYQVPSIYVKYLWNKIFSESGFKYKYQGRSGREDYNLFLSEEWEEVAITIDEGFPGHKKSIDAEKKLSLSVNKMLNHEEGIPNIWGAFLVSHLLIGEIVEPVRFQSVFDKDGLHVSSTSLLDNRSRIRIKESGFYKIDVSGNFYNLKTEVAGLFIEKDGYDLFTINESFSKNQSKIGFTQKLYLREGEELLFTIKTHPLDNSSKYSYDLEVDLWLDNTVTAVNFSSYLSKIKQKDFVKDVMNFYGLIPCRKKETYEFISYEELLTPLIEYKKGKVKEEDVFEDWSSKFHSVIEVDSKVGNYAKYNLFKYKYDNVVDTFADGFIKIDDDTLSDRKILVERPYKAPDNSSSVISNSTLKKCDFYMKEIKEDGTIKGVKPKKTSPFFHRVKKQYSTINYKVSGAIGESSFKGVCPFMSFENLDFNHVLPNRYAGFSNMVNFGQRLKVKIYLSILDIHHLDFFKLKYFKQLGSLYYLSKSIKFTGNGLTTVELIKIKSIERKGSFSDEFSNDFNI